MRSIIGLFFVLFLGTDCIYSQEAVLFPTYKKTVVSFRDTVKMNFISDSSIYTDGWDTLPQSIFWRKVINLTNDTCIINIANCRKPVDKITRSIWMNQSEPERNCFKDSICRIYGLETNTELNITAGKDEFYEIKKVLPEINKAIRVFKNNQCDPWYAQAILLIESPGKVKSKSSVGANGPFQLMKSVAMKYGLRVNRKIDERIIPEKAARAASLLLMKSCIPSIKNYLNEHNIAFKETDLWFRLLVLHAYHAGAGNIRCVLNEINPSQGGIELFQKIWQTTCGGFKNESQNYSQIAIASLINFDHLVHQYGDTVFLVEGDRIFRDYSRKSHKLYNSYEFLNRCLAAYENDFLDDVIPYGYFMKKVTLIRKEYARIAKQIAKSDNEVVLRKYPSSEEHLTMLASNLTRRQRFEDAISLLKLNLDIYPESTSSLDSIARLYRLTGNKKNADLYSNKAGALVKDGIKNND